MTVQTYRLEVRDSGAGIDADVYDEDDLIEASTQVAYEDYDLEPAEGRDEPDPIVLEVTADVTTLDLQVERDGAGFTFRVLGDQDELLVERVEDDAWELE